MQTVTLGTTGRDTTRLGFGGSSLMGSMGRTESLAVLDAAFDAGIRHFDVAPMYGFGDAERVLGDFLASHPGQLTVTTKFGIPPETRTLKSQLRGLARPILKAIPGLKRRLQAAGATAGAPLQLDFSVDKAQASLDKSLRLLRLERIDVFLLHEASAPDLADDRLLRLLENAVIAGKIGTFGVGSEAHKIPALLAERPGYCPVTQYEWSVLDPLIEPGPAFRIHHRSLTDNFRALHEALVADTRRSRRWSDFCGANVADASVLARLMLKAALLANPDSVILFSSKQPRNIASNAALVDDPALDEAALKFYSLVRAEAVQGSAYSFAAGAPA
jgi:aryl-alcohol dehydrogenase-like predicted oxidoreductase